MDRGRRAGRWLEWKVRLFTVGAVLGLAGIWTEESWMVLAAIAVLVVGALLRFLPDGGDGPGSGGPDPSDGPVENGDAGDT